MPETSNATPTTSKGGFLRLTEGGVRYTDSRYDYQQTVTPVSLATLTTGAMPATHGVVGDRWRDYADNAPVSLTAGWEGPGPYHLVAPTLAEALQEQSPDSRIVTVAAEATSAVVTAGRGGNAYWLDSLRCDWESSRYYAEQLPDWVVRSNRERDNLVYADSEWHMLLNEYYYRNTRRRAIAPAPHNKKSGDGLRLRNGYERLLATPAGNSAVLAFAAKAVAQYKLGADEKTDLLNICLDASRRITEKYGPESVEVEDMYYRLDSDLAEFLTFLFAQVEPENTLVVLTSDHGSSPSYDAGREEADRFNTRQFEVIVNGFLNVRYGIGNWVLEYRDRGLYLNHNLIYERGLNLADVQNEVAIFAMQFRGVSHAQSATALRTSYFGSGYARLMQNSFYPRRSGDVILNLMPGWIEGAPGVRLALGFDVRLRHGRPARLLRRGAPAAAHPAPRRHDLGGPHARARGGDRGAGRLGGRHTGGDRRIKRRTNANLRIRWTRYKKRSSRSSRHSTTGSTNTTT